MDFEKIENLQEVLKGRINGEVVQQVVTKMTAVGENYMSLILKLDLKVKNPSTNSVESIQAVAKLVPPGFFKTGMIFIPQVTFKIELSWYNVAVPIFKEFEEEHDLVGVFTDVCPNFYGGRISLDPKNDTVCKDTVVILEYLEGYETHDRLLGFDCSTTKEVLKVLAKLHAVSVALKRQKPELFEEKIVPMFTHAPKPPKNSFDPLGGILDIIKECPECQPFIHRCEEALKHSPFHSDERLRREPWATLIHNDFWVNNIMFKKYSNGQNKPQIKIVDYQAICYASFAKDLTFFLLTSVQPEVLKRNFDELLRLYYDVFIAYLKQLKVPDTEQFKYQDFLEELETECKTGQYGHATMFTNVVFRERGEGPDTVLDEHPDTFKKMMSTRTLKQKERIWDITKFCAEKNWL